MAAIHVSASAECCAFTAVHLTRYLLVCFPRWCHSQRAERQQALRLLHKVELIVSEVAVRLMHLENQVDDFVAYQQRGDSAADDEAAASTLNSCTRGWLREHLLVVAMPPAPILQSFT